MHARGNALIIILIAIGLVASLTYAVMKSSDEGGTVADYASADEQISRLMSYSGTLGAALNQMALVGNIKIHSDISVLQPGDAGFDTAPHMAKIFHPLGGGVEPQSATGPTQDTIANPTVARAFRVLTAAGVDDIGANATPDVLFTAIVTKQAYCERINKMLTGSSTVPVYTGYLSLFVTGTPSIITTAQCATCAGKTRLCVRNIAGTSWGFYAVLFPG